MLGQGFISMGNGQGKISEKSGLGGGVGSLIRGCTVSDIGTCRLLDEIRLLGERE